MIVKQRCPYCELRMLADHETKSILHEHPVCKEFEDSLAAFGVLEYEVGKVEFTMFEPKTRH